MKGYLVDKNARRLVIAEKWRHVATFRKGVKWKKD